MRQTSRPGNRPTEHGLGCSRPTATLVYVETSEERRKRLGVLLRRWRISQGIKSAKDLAELTGKRPSERTIAAVESGERVISASNYNAIELVLGLPLGVMEEVLRGEREEFPRPREKPAVTESEYEVGDKVYTRSELRTLMKALGVEGFQKWLESPTPHGGDQAANG